MITTIIGLALPVLIQLVGFFLTRAQASADAKKKWLELVASLGNEGLISVRLSKSYEDQRARLENDVPKQPT